MNYNSELLTPQLAEGKMFIDPSRFVTDAQAAREFPELPYLTLRVPTLACVHYEADECLSTVRLSHKAFYKRVYRSKPIAEPIYYEMLKMEAQLMTTDVDTIHNELMARYPFFQSDYLERRQLFGPVELMPGVETRRQRVAA
jgi:hypothetical protein